MSSLTYDLTLAGLSVGSAAALTGIGLIVTYRATGVLNFAHGAIAMVCAYRAAAVHGRVGLAAVARRAGDPVRAGPGRRRGPGALRVPAARRPGRRSGADPGRVHRGLRAAGGRGGAAVGAGGTGGRAELVSADPWGQLAVAAGPGGGRGRGDTRGRASDGSCGRSSTTVGSRCSAASTRTGWPRRAGRSARSPRA